MTLIMLSLWWQDQDRRKTTTPPLSERGGVDEFFSSSQIFFNTIAHFTINFAHFRYNELLWNLACMWGNFGYFVVLAQNCLTFMLDYIVMQMRKTNCEKGYWLVLTAGCFVTIKTENWYTCTIRKLKMKMLTIADIASVLYMKPPRYRLPSKIMKSPSCPMSPPIPLFRTRKQD